ncbi:MAG: hypothetical protein A3B91_03820 [Candidatus Yanofskybacteria bacterium RIFCSPHIGHO2_02_FULL_41_29]|uniref:Uncharacterized protein n=1 Tax=Candidatus Yanofskybacteria bacterium RIFCSPHIGHO2_01_FULL_41_53 TaxID=1802663 RepID=A0A1F8EJK7_9BACT|nr:MAG: hypothetical protein A2650_02420 [Candidatus Yanofskybacteria bacterium RIFCSPHIGHO2_01_FULL_41_53]OGN10880.1 MAG: hypothetical protein A3B91_03820 [Candidatus Yanofskybacteria bacterium RIFCSPHIGHO2_02_FULL_41_29]OGN16927.1 MAG: hypothetical protein A3F48_03095 [Candidatus Yanofskybacteria bacterium RIFCSPHIGHO2_12_FULL_41_9]OGN24457.1 MAG: hypothetical protein A2916_02360 [Candidatus Yanofskybacteria bacterium RIFCSPLOWO2_01_FULL_41_67]OGN29549.1 MAG: hypothetical protein A3H54_01460 
MVTIFLEYFYWHFTVAPFEILKIAGDYLKAARHQFLIVQHLKTLFSPWHRQNPSDFSVRQKTFSDKIMDSVADLYIRLIAAGVRLSIVFMGLIWQVILLICFGLLFVIWLAWPVIAVYSIMRGLAML